MLIDCLIVTNKARFDCFKLLLEQIEAQHVRSSWELRIVVVNGGGLKSEEVINIVNKIAKLPCKFIDTPKDSNYPIGYLRDIGNKGCDGDYIVCFDDDDYYFPTRIMHSVESLMNSTYLIAGCKSIYIYDHEFERYFISDESDRFASNGTLCYSKKYLEMNQYNRNKTVGEEASFLNDFNNEILQLDKKQMCIMNSHNLNTFSKREILLLATYGLHKYIKPKADDDKMEMPAYYLKQYKKIFVKNEYMAEKHIVILGGIEQEWDPQNQDLGGSEQAVVELMRELCTVYCKSIIPNQCTYYGKIKEEITIGRMTFKPFTKFNYHCHYQTLILWRDYGLMSFVAGHLGGNKIHAKQIIYDGHDNLNNIAKDLHIKFHGLIDKYFLKSYAHIDNLMTLNIRPDLIANKIKVIPNGVNDEYFKDYPKEDMRIKNRFIYCNSYVRGLLPLLAFT